MPRFCASSIRSKYTLPEQATTRLTFFALPAVLSEITVWKPPSASSASEDTASLWRSSDLGLITTRGLRVLRFVCMPRKWNICAGVVGTHTCMLSRARSPEHTYELTTILSITHADFC